MRGENGKRGRFAERYDKDGVGTGAGNVAASCWGYHCMMGTFDGLKPVKWFIMAAIWNAGPTTACTHEQQQISGSHVMTIATAFPLPNVTGARGCLACGAHLSLLGDIHVVDVIGHLHIVWPRAWHACEGSMPAIPAHARPKQPP